MKKLILPANVKIANHVFEIQEWDSRDASTRPQQGEYSPDTLVIRVCLEFSNSHVKETLLHEINRAIWWSYNLHDTDKEERIVTTLSVGLSQVFQDNPIVAEFLLKGENND